MKKIFILVIFVFLLCSCSESYTSNNIEDYNRWVKETPYAEDVLSQPSELGNYTSIKFTHKTPHDLLISTTTTIAIFVSYDSENYKIEKEKNFEKYIFFKETNEDFESISAEVNGYDFKIVEQIENNEMYNDWIYSFYFFLVIGYNNDSDTIAYLYFWDSAVTGTRDLQKAIEKKVVF